jgi:hypothetical protein
MDQRTIKRNLATKSEKRISFHCRSAITNKIKRNDNEKMTESIEIC